MYCSNCGNLIPDDARFCGKCGKPVTGLLTAAEAARARLARHLPVLALLWVIYSILRIFAGSVMVLAGWMFLPRFLVHGYHPFVFSFFGWPFSGFFWHGLVAGLGFGVFLLGVLGLVAGWGLWRREGWARLLAVILGVLALFHFPLGTALGIYTLWVLLPREAATEYGRPIPTATR